MVPSLITLEQMEYKAREVEHKAYELAFEEEYKKMHASPLKRVPRIGDFAALLGSDEKTEQEFKQPYEEPIHCHHRTRSPSTSQSNNSKLTYLSLYLCYAYVT
jgi:hypothetical protein